VKEQLRHIANTQQLYTLASRTSQRTDQSLPKSMPAPTQEKITHGIFILYGVRECATFQNIFSYPSKKIKTPDPQTITLKTLKFSIDNGLQERTTRTTGYNRQFCKMAGLVLNSSAVLRLNLNAKLNICTSISATSPAARRYRPVTKTVNQLKFETK